MRVLVIGLGLVGREVARALRARGDVVVGTTTTASKVDELRDAADEVRVLVGSDAAAVAAAADGCEAVISAAGPSVTRSQTPAERASHYRDVLVGTARSVVAAPVPGPVVFLSSLSVYGDAADFLDRIDESAPTTDSDDPSPAAFLEAERTYLEQAPGRAVVFRCGEIYGDDDLPIGEKVALAHRVFGGSVPFGADALFYRVHAADVAAACLHALDAPLRGVVNLTHAEVPARNAELFDALGAERGLPPLVYRGEIHAPSRPISVQRLLDAGVELRCTVAPTLASTPARQ